MHTQMYAVDSLFFYRSASEPNEISYNVCAFDGKPAIKLTGATESRRDDDSNKTLKKTLERNSTNFHVQLSVRHRQKV